MWRKNLRRPSVVMRRVTVPVVLPGKARLRLPLSTGDVRVAAMKAGWLRDVFSGLLQGEPSGSFHEDLSWEV